jgi:hypothetical protein
MRPVALPLRRRRREHDGRFWPGGRGTGDRPDNLCFGVAGAPDRTSDPANWTTRQANRTSGGQGSGLAERRNPAYFLLLRSRRRLLLVRLVQ